MDGVLGVAEISEEILEDETLLPSGGFTLRKWRPSHRKPVEKISDGNGETISQLRKYNESGDTAPPVAEKRNYNVSSRES